LHINFNEFITSELIPCRYTSHESQTERDASLALFKDGGCSALVAMKCLDEGIDIPSARTAVLISSTTNPREYIQRIGRVIRRSPEKKIATIYDFMVVRNNGELFAREINRGLYVAQYAENATSVYDILYHK
jgi:superfamily II DNA or RNA helicase